MQRLQISIQALTITGGHGDGWMPSGLAFELFPRYPGMPVGICNGIEGVRQRTREVLRAGADKVISPYAAGGRQMANIALRPHVAEFMEVVNFGAEMEMWLEDVRLAPGSSLVGMTVVETDVRRRTGAVLVALLRGEARLALIPDETTHLMAGDELIALGTREQLARLEALASTAEADL